jgi:hypothetical protein
MVWGFLEKLTVTQLVRKCPFLRNVKVHYCVHERVSLDFTQYKWEDSIKMGIKEIGCEWTGHLAQKSPVPVSS